ncbi:MAG: Ig-like domain-containing protein [Actinomycetes bacterium]
MQTALVRRNSMLPPVFRFDVAWRTVAIVAVLAALVTGIVVARSENTTAVQANAATVWMSGEARGRVVLAAARGERPSVAIELGTEPTAYDLADLGASVVVHDRTSGTIVELDARDGTERTRVSGPTPTDARPLLVGAGTRAYLVDPAARTVRQLASDGTFGETVPVAGAATDWVGTLDGLLWLVDDAEGSFARFDGENLTVERFADRGSRFRITAAGREPVVYDDATGRLRWLRQASSTTVPGRVAGEPVLVQEPDPTATCISVLAGSTLSCIGDAGVVREVTVGAPLDPTATQLFSGDTHAVVAGPGSSVVQTIAWADGSVRTDTRPEPSGRALTGSALTGAVVIDDPGSRYSFSVDRGELVQLDKFSRRTIVIASDGSSADGIGAFDESADVEGIVTGGDAQAADLDDNGVNDPPQPRDDRSVTRVGRSVVIGVLANDVDPDGDPLQIVRVDPIPASEGVATALEGTRINFQPAAGSANRTISFGYTVADPGGLEGSATVSVEVVSADRNTDPRSSDDRATTPVNTSVDVPVLVNDVDDEGDPLNITQLTEPLHGTAAIEGSGTIRYEPALGFTGDDSFTYTVQDGYGGESTATVTLEVTEPPSLNRAPVAEDDRSPATAGVRQRVDVLANDGDADGDTLRIVGTSGLPNVEIVVVDERLIDVTPAAGTSGLLTFTYTVADPDGLADTATVALVVTAPAPQLPPTAVADNAVSASVPITIDVVVNDIDPSQSQLVVVSVDQPPAGEGSVSQVSPTSVRYTPPAQFFGTARFTYTIQNAAGLTARGNVTVTVTPRTGSGPVARPDSATVFVGESVTLFPMGNDTHVDRLPFDFTGQLTTRTGTTATINPDRSVTITPPDLVGVYVVGYTVQDEFLARSSSTITVSVVARPAVNRPPSATNDLASTAFNTAVTVDVLANDTDPDGDVVRLIDAGPASAGNAVVSGSRIRFTPSPTFTGAASIPYVVADPAGLTSTATLTVQVAERVQVAPVTTPDLTTLVTGATGTINPLANDLDPDGAASELRLTGIGTPSTVGAFTASRVTGGVRIVAGTTPGSYTLPYTIADADGQTAIGTITVVVQLPPNAPPVALNDTVTGEATTTTIRVLDNDEDPDGGALALVSVSALSPTAAGTLAVSGGTVVYTPASSSYAGTATFTYVVRDPEGATDTGTVTLTIVACPAPPTLPAVSVGTPFQTPVAIPLFPDGPPASTATSVLQPTPTGTGTVSYSAATGVATYTPPAAYNGTATFTYRAITSCGVVVNGTVAVDVNRSPVAVADPISTGRNQPVVVPVTANDTDLDGDVLTVASVSAVTPAAAGRATLLAGVVTFTPSSTCVGTARFTYVVRDVGGLTATGTVTVTVDNAAPVALDDTLVLPTLTAATLAPVLANDTDANGDTLTITDVDAVGPVGAVVVANTGTALTVSTLGVGDPGTFRFTYTVSDGTLTATAELTVVVTNRPPIAVPDVGTIDLETQTSVTVDVLENDSDLDGGSGELSIVSQSLVAPAGAGTVTVSGGSITFTPSGTLTAPETVTISYLVEDADGGTATGTLTITVTRTPPPTTTDPPPTIAAIPAPEP